MSLRRQSLQLHVFLIPATAMTLTPLVVPDRMSKDHPK